MAINNIIDQLTRDEGFRPMPYTDTTGHATVGIGHNLVASPLPNEVYPMHLDRAQAILELDVLAVESHLGSNLPWYLDLDQVRAGVLVNAGFNLGVAGLLQFHNTLSFMQRGNWQAAANGLLSSLAAKELPERYGRLAQQLITGEWQ